MKYLLVTFVFLVFNNHSYGQKPSIDSATYDKWQSVDNPKISNDGKYASYSIINKPVGGKTLVIKSIFTSWRIDIPGAYGSTFTQDSKKLIFSNAKDSLGIVILGNGNDIQYLANVEGFELVNSGSRTYLAYEVNSPRRKLVLRDLMTNEEKSFDGATSYFFSSNGKLLLFEKDAIGSNHRTKFLEMITLNDFNQTTIFEGREPSNIVFDDAGGQLCFTAPDSVNHRKRNVLWYYRAGTLNAKMLIGQNPNGIDSTLNIDRIVKFKNDGSGIFFTLEKEKQFIKPSAKIASVDVWSYTDGRLQSQQLKDSSDPFAPSDDYTSVIQIANGRIIRLEEKGDKIKSYGGFHDLKEKFVLIYHTEGGNRDEWNWNKKSQNSIFLVSTEDGTREQINKNTTIKRPEYIFSPKGDYLIYYDPDQKNYFSYSIADHTYRNITKGVKASWSWSTSGTDSPTDYLFSYPVPGFLKGDTSLIVYDLNDIFQVDITGKSSPINLTNGFGIRHHIQFRLAMIYPDSSIGRKGQRLILNAFDMANKNNGFYVAIPGRKMDPQLLTMKPLVFEGAEENSGALQTVPIKAKDTDIYIVRRMNSNESANYFWTNNFKEFRAISDCYPEKAYNWLTSELITWKTLDGSISQGILYKPENFDKKKKYPVIFYYYEKVSDGLHNYIAPSLGHGALNIPFYVSSGYLVFSPDIHYKIGNPGQSVYNSVVSAAHYIAQMPWVDSKKLGIEGHSWGGYETYYLITHTNIFAAASSGEGVTDFVSDYLRLEPDGASSQFFYEIHQMRMGTMLWQRPDLYIRNSPIFQADRVHTPLLMMDNENDYIVPFAQGVELFTALRRLGKKVWMLQYDDGGHLVGEVDDIDHTTRLKQFFDYYLRSDPAPKWMVEGIPAYRKGIDDGLELEPPGIEPGPGLLTPEAERSVDSLQYRKPITVRFK